MRGGEPLSCTHKRLTFRNMTPSPSNVNKPSVVLEDFRGEHEVELPGYPGSKVVIYDDVLFGDAALLAPILEGKHTTEAVMPVLMKLIKEWNFTDKEGVDLPITDETIGRLSIEALTHLAEAICAAISDKKKEAKS